MRARWTWLPALVLGTCTATLRGDDAETYDFLDYLGAMVEQDGEWVDPLAVAGDEFARAAADDEREQELDEAPVTPASEGDDNG